MDDYISGGRVMQRFWLTSAQMGLQFQPEMTPLIFSRYVNESETFTQHFTQNDQAYRQAEKLAADLEMIAGKEIKGHSVFMGRVGKGVTPISRSIRLSVAEVIVLFK